MTHLSDYMTARELDDEAVAAAIDVSRVTISRIRRRKVRPDWSTLGKLKRWSNGEITADAFQTLDADAEAAQ